MKKLLSILLVIMLLFSTALAEMQPPPEGNEPPEMPNGEAPGMPPEGEGMGGTPLEGGAPGGAPGGNAKPESYAAAYSFTEDTTLEGETFESTAADENTILVDGAGNAALSGASISRVSKDSTGGDTASFYGVGAAALVTDGELRITNSTIDTDAAGGAGVFAYGSGVAYVVDTTITTKQDTSGGIHVAGGGTLYAKNLTVETNGESAAAIRSDRGSGVMVVDGGTYVSNGVGSPAVYVTADITINDATLTATGSEALCMEGKNDVRIYGSVLSGDMKDLSQNDNTWSIILYQSMSGDSEVGKGRFEMVGGEIRSANGGLFYTTNTQSEFVVSGVEITASEDSEYFLRSTGNANERVWGKTGANGADCKFTAIAQQMNGDVIWDSISKLEMYVTAGSTLTGALVNDETFAGDGASGYANVYIDAQSSWVVTDDSTLTELNCAGSIVDADGRTVSVVGADGTAYVEGDSDHTITVKSYTATCDLAGAGTTSQFSDYAVEM